MKWHAIEWDGRGWVCGLCLYETLDWFYALRHAVTNQSREVMSA